MKKTTLVLMLLILTNIVSAQWWGTDENRKIYGAGDISSRAAGANTPNRSASIDGGTSHVILWRANDATVGAGTGDDWDETPSLYELAFATTDGLNVAGGSKVIMDGSVEEQHDLDSASTSMNTNIGHTIKTVHLRFYIEDITFATSSSELDFQFAIYSSTTTEYLRSGWSKNYANYTNSTHHIDGDGWYTISWPIMTGTGGSETGVIVPSDIDRWRFVIKSPSAPNDTDATCTFDHLWFTDNDADYITITDQVQGGDGALYFDINGGDGSNTGRLICTTAGNADNYFTTAKGYRVFVEDSDAPTGVAVYEDVSGDGTAIWGQDLIAAIPTGKDAYFYDSDGHRHKITYNATPATPGDPVWFDDNAHALISDNTNNGQGAGNHFVWRPDTGGAVIIMLDDIFLSAYNEILPSFTRRGIPIVLPWTQDGGRWHDESIPYSSAAYDHTGGAAENLLTKVGAFATAHVGDEITITASSNESNVGLQTTYISDWIDDDNVQVTGITATDDATLTFNTGRAIATNEMAAAAYRQGHELIIHDYTNIANYTTAQAVQYILNRQRLFLEMCDEQHINGTRGARFYQCHGNIITNDILNGVRDSFTAVFHGIFAPSATPTEDTYWGQNGGCFDPMHLARTNVNGYTEAAVQGLLLNTQKRGNVSVLYWHYPSSTWDTTAFDALAEFIVNYNINVVTCSQLFDR